MSLISTTYTFIQGSQYRTNTGRIGMYTGIETSTFRTGLNTNRTGHVQAIPAGIEKKKF